MSRSDRTRSLHTDDESADAGPLALVVAAGPDVGNSLAIDHEPYVVGTAPDAALRLTDPAVSRRHLQLTASPGGVEVRDLGSKNGSYYLGARFEVIRVGAGAHVTLGVTTLAILPRRTREAPISSADRFGRLAGQTATMRRIFAALERLARTDASILLIGETGTGKDLAAQAIHAASPRAAGPFVVCDLGAIPATLIEGELFGHVRGAFTGADRDRAGAFEQAHGGTLFLDEIGELTLPLQPRLLRALESSSVKRLGAASYARFDVRVIAATNRDLGAEVAAGTFRADLFHRLAVAEVRIPPLRERLDDIPLLVERFLDDLAARGAPHLSVPAETTAALRAYGWPGNVRQLRNVVERAVALGPADQVLRSDVLGLGTTGDDEVGRVVPVDPSVPFKDAKDRLIHVWEREYVTGLIERSAGNIALAARSAGIDRAHLYRIMRKHGIKGSTQ